MNLIIHATIYDFDQFKADQYIVFDEQIIDVGPMSHCPKLEATVIDAKGSLVMPSLVNGHSHIYSTFSRGLQVPFQPTNFVEMLEQLWWKLDRNLTNEFTYYSGIVTAVESIKNGVTTLIDHHASGEIKGSLSHLKKAIVEQAHLRGVFCFETSDRFNIKESITENLSFIDQNKTDQVRGLFGMHASLTLSEETLKQVHDVIEDNPIHIHVAESIIDQEDCLKRYDETIIERLKRHYLLNKDSIIAHGIYCTTEDLTIMKEQEVVVAVNVTSNMNNSVGLPDILRFMNEGIPVIIGNDGISASMAFEYEMLYFAMHHLYQSPTIFTMDHLKTLIQNTYQYTSRLLETKLGLIQPGYEADLVIIPYNPPTPLHQDNVFGHLVFGVFHNFKPQYVFVKGNRVLDNYQVSASLQQEYNQAHQFAAQCWQQIEKEGTL